MSLVAGIIGCVFFFSELGLRWRRRSSLVPESREVDRHSLSVLWAVIGGSVTAGYILVSLAVGPTLPSGLPWQWISLGVFVTGTVVRWWSIRHLGRFFTVDVALAADHHVVHTGPYRLVRHPSYSGLLLQLTGLALSLNNGLSLAVIVIPATCAILYRIRLEEQALLAQLGPEYAKYRLGTNKLVPFVY